MFARLHRRHTFLRWGISTAVAMLLVVFILFVWFSWARMGNDSMAPTLHKGDLVLVDRLSKYYRNLQRTDLVAYVPKDGQGLIIKRVVALGGERVAGKDGVIYIDDTYTLVERDYGPTNTLDFSPVKVPEGCVFVLSDDRLYFEDMAIYSMVKNNTFNGMALPAIWKMDAAGDCTLVKKFGYEDFKGRLS